MHKMIKVQKVAGRDSLMSDGREWPNAPILVEKNHYIRRRIKAGDIVEVKEITQKAPILNALVNAENTLSQKAKTATGNSQSNNQKGEA